MPPRDLDDQVVVRRLTAIRELVDLLARQGEVSGAQLRDDLVLRLAVERALSQLVDLASDVNSHVVAVAGIVVVMLVSSDSSRTQVWTSLVAVAVLAVFWPLVHRNLKRREDAEVEASPDRTA